MPRPAATAVVLLSLLCGAAPSHRAEAQGAMINGDFERPAPAPGRCDLYRTGSSFQGWKVVGARGNVAICSTGYRYARYSFPAARGDAWLDLTGLSNSATGVAQSVATIPGKGYRLSFSLGNVAGAGMFGTTSVVQVNIDGERHLWATHDGGKESFLSWKRVETQFVATKDVTSIEFINGDGRQDNSNGIDDISVDPL